MLLLEYSVIHTPPTSATSSLLALNRIGNFKETHRSEGIQDLSSLTKYTQCSYLMTMYMQVAFRLKLLMTPSCVFTPQSTCTFGANIPGSSKRAAIFDLERKMFSLLDRDHNDGCGYISGKQLTKLFGNTAVALQLVAVQVRAVVPGLGIFKGVLVRSL